MLHIHRRLFYSLIIFCFLIIYSDGAKHNKGLNKINRLKNDNKYRLLQHRNSENLYLWKFYAIPKNYLLAKKGTILGIYLRQCFNRKNKNQFYISSNNKSYYAQNDQFHTKLCEISKYKCLYYPHQSYFKVPHNIVSNLEEIEIVSKITGKKRTFHLDTTAANSKPFDGITVCTPLLYYYNNWLQMFMFLEKWREEKNVRIMIYYRSLSRDVFELLKYYEKLNIVYLIPSPIFPRNDPMQKFVATSGGMGPLFFNDCMYRNNANYLTVMDVDEYFHIFDEQSRKKGLLEFVKKKANQYPMIGFFNFQSYYMSYINKKVDDSFNFATESLLTLDSMNIQGKSIMLTNKIYYPSYHIPLFKKENDGYRFKKNEGILLHARPNYIFKNVESKDKIQFLGGPEKLKFNSEYRTLEKNLNKTLVFKYKHTVISDRCILKNKKKSENYCNWNIEECGKQIDLLENWIYTSEKSKNYQEYVKLK
uniref:Glycosyltransferase family 92 protein n=1 Tax=Strongyloides papillosus TaxID=174720 RepID=A0A0N5BAI5_STREA